MATRPRDRANSLRNRLSETRSQGWPMTPSMIGIAERANALTREGQETARRNTLRALFCKLLEVSDKIFAVLLVFDAWEDHFGFRHKRNWIFKILEKVLL